MRMMSFKSGVKGRGGGGGYAQEEQNQESEQNEVDGMNVMLFARWRLYFPRLIQINYGMIFRMKRP